MESDRDILVEDNRKISIRLEQLANQTMAQKDLTACQARILLYILQHSSEALSLTDLHRKFGYSMAALSAQIKHLRAKGYIQAVPCADDDRKKLLVGTRKGEEVHQFLVRSIQQVHSRLYDRFSEAELNALDSLQKKMLRNLSALSEDFEEVDTL